MHKIGLETCPIESMYGKNSDKQKTMHGQQRTKPMICKSLISIPQSLHEFHFSSLIF